MLGYKRYHFVGINKLGGFITDHVQRRCIFAPVPFSLNHCQFMFRVLLKSASGYGIFSLCWRHIGCLWLFLRFGRIVVFLKHSPLPFSILIIFDQFHKKLRLKMILSHDLLCVKLITGIHLCRLVKGLILLSTFPPVQAHSELT